MQISEEELGEVFSAAYSVPRSWAQTSPGEQLRVLRESRKMSQRHLADVSGLDQADICRLERGADARWETLKRLFAGLGYAAALVPLATSDDVEDLIEDELEQRQDRIEAGREARW
jgi:transcriptional regulator with XRE-family HTH domain